MSTHKTTDGNGKKATNVIEVLKNNQMLSEKSFLLSCNKMYAVNHTIAQVFNEAMLALWPDGVRCC
jgi:hypothetical protein